MLSRKQCHEEITTNIEDFKDITEYVCTQASVNDGQSSNVGGHTSGVPLVAVALVAAVVGVARGAEAIGNGAGLVNQGIAKCKANAEPLADACNRANYNIGAAPLVVVHPN